MHSLSFLPLPSWQGSSSWSWILWSVFLGLTNCIHSPIKVLPRPLAYDIAVPFHSDSRLGHVACFCGEGVSKLDANRALESTCRFLLAPLQDWACLSFPSGKAGLAHWSVTGMWSTAVHTRSWLSEISQEPSWEQVSAKMTRTTWVTSSSHGSVSKPSQDQLSTGKVSWMQ